MLDIDLNKHGIIEAHAGTGKTWTIVNKIVLPALCGKNGDILHIRDILLVTYTEKAAGELKERIRKGIEKKLEEEKSQLKNHLEDCLNNFHEAYIGTIHSVCLRLLQNYPFECGLQLSLEIVDDREGLNSIIGELLRSLWTKIGIDEELLCKINIDPERLKKRIIEIASSLINNEVVLYNFPQKRTLSDIIADFSKREKDYSAIISIVKAKKEDIKIILNSTPQLSIDIKRKLENLYNKWSYITEGKTEEFTKNIKGNGRSANYLSDLLKGIKPVSTQIISLCDTYKDLFTKVNTEKFERYLTLEDEFILYTILQITPILCEKWKIKKRKEGLISFQDMISFTHKAIYQNENFRKFLRKKFKLAVIDEFQDTGVLQWEIFKKVFIDESNNKNNPKLFIIGDPKQSIYSFQNAVVESYLDACGIIDKSGIGQRYTLIENYRTTERLISAYNILFTFDDNFFCSDRIKYEKNNLVKVAACHENKNIENNVNPFFDKPLKIVPLYGNSYLRLLQYSLFIIDTIKKLYGVKVKIPEGNDWQSINIDYNHFAIVAENHNIADTILNFLIENGIPATKYKHEGIFSSKIAAQFRTLLTAIKNGGTDFSTKIKSFLTNFFGYKPEELTPDTVPIVEEKFGFLFSKWHSLAEREKWPLLFRSILEESGIRERLLKIINGERHLSDLRQIIDYSLQLLLSKKYTLDELTEHLFAISEGYARAYGDINIYAKESEKNKVQVMTIHAAKGLEFPVCFVVPLNKTSINKGDSFRWVDIVDKSTDPPKRGIYIMPSEVRNISLYKEIAEEKEEIVIQQKEMERRRLLYVAITRAKLLLFIPMYLDLPREEGQKWKECKKAKGNDNILTNLLMEISELVENGVTPYANYIEICDTSSYLYQSTKRKTSLSPQLVISSPFLDHDVLKELEGKIVQAIKKIDIPSRRNILTSYTAIVSADKIKHSESIEEYSDEQYSEEIITIDEFKREELFLPPGPETGIVLHKIIETILSIENWKDILINFENNYEFIKKIELILANNSFFKNVTEEKKESIIQKVLKIVSDALFCNYELPDYGEFSICSLNSQDIKTEAEFYIGDDSERLIGYIDLLFRVKCKNEQYKYFIIDWKSNLLDSYSQDVIESDIKRSLYDIQSKIYCHGLHRWLSFIIGENYIPSIHLGGALYVYLRGFESLEKKPYWFYKADPLNDEIFFKTEIKNFIKNSGYVFENK